MAAVLRMRRTRSPRKVKLLDELPAYLAVRVADAVTDDEREAFLRGVYAGEEAWTPNFDGVQFTLGRAWYTHLEQDKVDEYFARAIESDATVERFAPGLAAHMMTLARELVGGPVVQRAGWCGPGVHVFPAGREVADTGGEVHFDTEGLGEAELGARARALSFVLMLQPPEKGGGLRVWDTLYDGDDHPSPPPPDLANAIIQYEPGELVVLDSYRLHQILPFEGGVDRVSATMHLVEAGEAWEAWF